MAEPLSIASGIAGLITLSSAILAAGYKYLDAVSSAQDDLKSLIREIAALNTILSQLVSNSLSLSPTQGHQDAFNMLAQQGVLLDCEQVLQKIQSLLDGCELTTGKRHKNVVNTLFWPSKQKDIIKNRERLSRLCTSLHTAISIDIASGLKKMEQRHEKDTEDRLQDRHDIQAQKILVWLSPVSPLAKHTATRLLHQPGTYKWLLHEQAFLDWMNSVDFLWLYGHSGVGKTVMASSVIDHLIDKAKIKPGSAAIAYYYCEFTNPATLEPAHIVGSLVRQLIEPMNKVPSYLLDMYHKDSGEAATFSMLIELLQKAIEHRLGPTYIIIDGVDECPNRKVLLGAMQQLRSACKKKMKILLSSRPEYDMHQSLSAEAYFPITPNHITSDLDVHVRIELAKMPKLNALSHFVREDLVSSLVTRADGMFRWVQCQLDVLRKMRTSRALQDALNTLPAGLYETYDRILDSIDESDHEYVLRLLNWLVGSGRPLSLEELAEAVAINPDRFDPSERLLEPEEIFDLCGSLIRREENGIIALAHFSVKEYLLSSRLAARRGQLAHFALKQISSERYVSTCILSYVFSISLRIQELQQDVLEEREFPLLEYAKWVPLGRFRDYDTICLWIARHLPFDEKRARKWIPLISYVRNPAGCEDNYLNAWFAQKVLRCTLMCFLNGNMARSDRSVPKPGTLQCVKRMENLFLGWQNDWDNPAKREELSLISYWLPAPTPLCTAAINNFKPMVQWLLANGAFIDGSCPPRSTANPLIRALIHGNEDVVRILIDSGADVNVCCPDMVYSTALKAAASRDSRLVEYLLQSTKVNPNMLDTNGRSIRYWATHDSRINPNLSSSAFSLKRIQDCELEYWDTQFLYANILNHLKSMRGYPTVRYHHARTLLSDCLFHCGPAYYEYAAIFAEQALVSGRIVEHFNFCSTKILPENGAAHIRGKRFKCLVCADGDFCAGCYESWKQSNGKMEMCKGHSFYELPRPCWYRLKKGTVTEDGQSLSEVVEFLEKRFTALLEKKEEEVVNRSSSCRDSFQG